MRKLRVIACLLLLGLLIPAALHARSRLPGDAQPLIEKKYGGWAGTLRLWVHEGWTPGAGSAAGWLNRCVAAFEKRHPGVYIQPEYVEASALRDLGADGILPPDLALFPPGIMETGDALLPLQLPGDIRKPLRGDDRAAPILLGGTLWAYNTDALAGIPDDWRTATIPDDEPHHLWRAALLALSIRGEAEAEATPAPAGEVDLGLAAFAAAPADAYRAFVNGDAPATLVTQREVRRLQALDDQGTGPQWRLAGWTGPMFTDQVLYLGVVDKGDAERAALCREFAAHLLSDACQGTLSAAGAFAVTDAASGYAPGDPLAIMDAALRTDDLAAAPPFGTAWQIAVRQIVREFADPGADATALWPRLRAAVGEISEH